MFKYKDLTIKNFLSVGNVTQSVSFDQNDITLILGENLDLGGSGSKNGVGKCIGINTIVKVKNTITGEIYEITIGELYDISKRNTGGKND